MIETGMSAKAMIIKLLIIAFNRVVLGRSEYIVVVSSIIKEDINFNRIVAALDEAVDDPGIGIDGVKREMNGALE